MTKKQTFSPLANYVKLFDGYGKPRLNFQELYKLFPDFEFIASHTFGNYENFNQAFENKNYNMTVLDMASGNECDMVYKEYQDANENLAYISI